jgi:hypothetical protein
MRYASSSDTETVDRLKTAYSDISLIDLWVGALSEDIVSGALVGELIQTVCKRQFENLRDGDRFWYQNILSGDKLAEIESTKLSDIILFVAILESEASFLTMSLSQEPFNAWN